MRKGVFIMKGLIIEEVAKITIPIIQIIGFYIILFGHITPGGGFAGGTIIAISLILNNIILNKKVAGYLGMMRVQIIALMMYVLLKGYSILDSNLHIGLIKIGTGVPGKVLSGGLILPLNIIVSIVVSISIYFLFCLFYKGEI